MLKISAFLVILALSASLAVAQTTPNRVVTIPATGTGGFTAVTVGTSSAQALAAAPLPNGRKLLAIDNESTTATIACRFGAAAALNTAGSYTIPAGAIMTWSAPSYVPADVVNCIATAAGTPVTIEAH